MTSLINPIGTCEVNQRFHGNLIVNDVKKGLTRTDKEYLNVRLGDKTGSITAMVWDSTPEKERFFAHGEILNIIGVVTEYNGNKQLSIQHYASPTDGVTVEDMLPSAPINGETLNVMIRSKVMKIECDVLKLITLEILDEYHELLITHPASKSVHHNYIGGLLYHTYTMVNLAERIADNYDEIGINHDLLIAGTILHDIGKTEEYESAYAPDRTLKGKLIGHISMIHAKIENIARRMGEAQNESVILLQHMVLSHHGLAENGWGSPVSPLTIEAHILHTVDALDAGMDAYKAKLENTKPGEFTERIFGLNNRSFYVPKINK